MADKIFIKLFFHNNAFENAICKIVVIFNLKISMC